MKILTVIQARVGSTRFPGKVLAELGDKTVLEHVIDAAQQFGPPVVIATTELIEDRRIIRVADKRGIPCFSVGNRPLECGVWMHRIAQSMEADFIVRVCGDSPFIDIALAKDVLDRMAGYAYCSNSVNGIPAILTKYGVFVEVFHAYQLSNMIEHTTMGFYKMYGTLLLPVALKKNWKASIDLPEDLEFCRKIFNIIGRRPVSCFEIDALCEDGKLPVYEKEMVQKYERR